MRRVIEVHATPLEGVIKMTFEDNSIHYGSDGFISIDHHLVGDKIKVVSGQLDFSHARILHGFGEGPKIEEVINTLR